MTEIALSRRQFLNSSAGVVGLSSAAGLRRSEQARISRRLVIPAVDAFDDNSVGQFVFIDESADESVGDVPIEECGFEGWSDEQTQVYQGQLLDRRQELPITVELTVYADGDKAQIEPATHFIIQNTVSCPGGYVGLEAEWVPTRALVGKPPGPTVTETGADGQTGTELPGFGLVDARLDIGGLLLSVRSLAFVPEDRSARAADDARRGDRRRLSDGYRRGRTGAAEARPGERRQVISDRTPSTGIWTGITEI